MPQLNIVLVEPEIPQNTGNVARTCAATGARLHLVEPMGFAVDDKKLKRAGLDYWHELDIRFHDSLTDFLAGLREGERLILASTKSRRRYDELPYRDGDYLVFGKESRGLPENLIAAYYDTAVRIPMLPDQRSLNLSNSVAIVLYEALRQTGFPGLRSEGELTGREERELPL